ncbi:uncharacterized protein LOC104582852 [Brachypodium distachyon]|nr:uncharacterized protein LOC104582852 [Brachypodium distachyon]|eukprot:XP_010232198.1 uncharacterized protein LOC104582852 [Brachypodium distachyon]
MAGQNSPMVVDCNCATKIKEEGTELAAGEQCACATKLKLPEPAKQPAAGGDGVEAPTKKMTRLSQEDIDWILSQTKQPDHKYYELGTSPEEVAEEREFYRSLCESYDSHWEEFSRFQDWVRGEYSTKGFVEVDDDFLARRASCKALIEEEWDKMFEGFSDADFGEDTDLQGDDVDDSYLYAERKFT